MTVSSDLDRRFRDAASTLELVDVSYDVLETEIGPLLAAVTDHGLAFLSFDAHADERLESLATFAGSRVLRTTRGVELVRRELDESLGSASVPQDIEAANRLARAIERKFTVHRPPSA